ncbi:MAG: hypothetical protein M1350_06740, partial [Actinobacteria bacterium]|nr:hypothetical protein [Actinomycetota bacterium]
MTSRAGQTLTSLLIARNNGIPLHREIPSKIRRKALRILKGQYGPLRARSYAAWIAKFDTIDAGARARLARHLEAVFPTSSNARASTAPSSNAPSSTAPSSNAPSSTAPSSNARASTAPSSTQVSPTPPPSPPPAAPSSNPLPLVAPSSTRVPL